MKSVLAAMVFLLIFPGAVWAQDTLTSNTSNQAEAEEHGAADLANKLSNPISSLISVPFQSNYDCCFGDSNASRWLTNIQPVIPLSLTDDWNLIVRTILPVINEQPIPPQFGGGWGLGDTLQSFFFSPKEPTSNGIVWGVGPALLYPTGTRDYRSNRWAAGPTFVALKQESGWTVGLLANQIWSYDKIGGGDPVSQVFLQPFLSYTTKSAFTVALNSESTYYWFAKQWSAPINLEFSQVFKIAGQPVSLQVGPRYYVATVPGGPRWGARFNFVLLFPT